MRRPRKSLTIRPPSLTKTAKWATKRVGRRSGRCRDKSSCWWHMPMKKTMGKRQSESSRRAERGRKNARPTSGSSIRVVTSDELRKDPKLRAKRKRELTELAKGGPIDYSDAPQLPPPAWEKPVRGLEAWLKTVRTGAMYKPVKQAVSMRLDADVVAWLKESGPGYQTRANRILREKMMEELAS